MSTLSRRLGLGAALVFALLQNAAVGAFSPVNPQTVKLAAKFSPESLERQQSASFPQFTFTQPLDHFSDTGLSFEQRYWVSDRHYRAGGPVIVFETGESSGTSRIPILDTGIIDILANATNGLGVILEHRYYGQSCRWLERAVTDGFSVGARQVCPGSELHHRLLEVRILRERALVTRIDKVPYGTSFHEQVVE